MIRDLLILPDGSRLFSGAGEAVSIKNLVYTQQLSGNTQLDFCCAAAAQLQVQLLDTTGSYCLAPGTALQYYRVDEQQQRLLMGTFYVQQSVRPEKYLLKITAYDGMLLAEQDMSAWLLEQSWPMTIQTLLEGVCLKCGLPLEAPTLCNADQPVSQFYQKITGRQLIASVAEANGVFAFVSAQGAVCFAPLTQAQGCLLPTDRKSCKLSQTPCAAIDRVAICQQSTDVGVVYPEEGAQTYRITGNPLLCATSELLQTCAQRLYQHLQGITYTPMEAQIFVPTLQLPCRPGQLVTVQTDDRTTLCGVFSLRLEGNTAQLKSWGQPSRESAAALYSRDTVKILQKQMTSVQVDVQQVGAQVSRVEAEFSEHSAQVMEDIGQLQVQSDGINAQVSRMETAVQTDLSLLQHTLQTVKKQAELSVTADTMALAISTALEEGTRKVHTTTGYTFDAQGLSIADSRSDIGNRIDHNGMLVRRGEEVLLLADSGGVSARDVTVGNYLIVGSHARLEDYQTGRTACFWL